MPLSLSQAQLITDQVRGYFATGPKSSNKVYIKDSKKTSVLKSKHDFLTKEDLERTKDAGIAIKALRQKTNKQVLSVYDAGYIVDMMPVPAGNCGEMADFTVFHIVRDTPLRDVYLGSLSTDHAFCFVGNPPPGPVAFQSLKKLGAIGHVLDPWLGVACSIDLYETEAHAQLSKWACVNKRIMAGKPGSKKTYVYVADQEYKDLMFGATITFTRYDGRYSE